MSCCLRLEKCFQTDKDVVCKAFYFQIWSKMNWKLSKHRYSHNRFTHILSVLAFLSKPIKSIINIIHRARLRNTHLASVDKQGEIKVIHDGQWCQKSPLECFTVGLIGKHYWPFPFSDLPLPFLGYLCSWPQAITLVHRKNTAFTTDVNVYSTCQQTGCRHPSQILSPKIKISLGIMLKHEVALGEIL